MIIVSDDTITKYDYLHLRVFINIIDKREKRKMKKIVKHVSIMELTIVRKIRRPLEVSFFRNNPRSSFYYIYLNLTNNHIEQILLYYYTITYKQQFFLYLLIETLNELIFYITISQSLSIILFSIIILLW